MSLIAEEGVRLALPWKVVVVGGGFRDAAVNQPGGMGTEASRRRPPSPLLHPSRWAGLTPDRLKLPLTSEPLFSFLFAEDGPHANVATSHTVNV